MDHRKLQTLLTVAASGSLNASAEQLHCTQSAVTQIMNTIENELGFPVFNRTNRGVTLTAEGSAIMPYVTAAEQALSELTLENRKNRSRQADTASRRNLFQHQYHAHARYYFRVPQAASGRCI